MTTTTGISTFASDGRVGGIDGLAGHGAPLDRGFDTSRGLEQLESLGRMGDFLT